MTHANKEFYLRSLRLGLMALLCVFAAPSALAKIELSNSVQKVEKVVGPQGDVERRMVEATSVVPGDELQYVVRFTNTGDAKVDAGTIVITDAIPPNTEYLDGTAFGAGTEVLFSTDGQDYSRPEFLRVQKEGRDQLAAAADYNAIRWTFGPELAPGESGYVSFNVRLK